MWPSIPVFIIPAIFFAYQVSIAFSQETSCLTECKNTFDACNRRCALSIFARICARYGSCRSNHERCKAKCPKNTETNGSRVIGRGECRSDVRDNNLRPNVRVVAHCPIPAATPEMNLRLRMISNETECIEGVTYGLSSDNSFMWTSDGCAGVFEVATVAQGSGDVQTADTTPSRGGGEGHSAATPSHSQSSSDQYEEPEGPATVVTEIGNHPRCGRRGNSGYRVLGGTSASRCEFPWMAFVYNQLSSKLCGGSILDEYHILTAAHCMMGRGSDSKVSPLRANTFVIITGTSNAFVDGVINKQAKRSYVSEIHIHPDYRHIFLSNDIAIMKLRQPIDFDNCHIPVCLPDGNASPQNAGECLVTGWGRTSNGGSVSGRLQWTTVDVRSDRVCQYYFRGNKKTFCAGGDGKDTCDGDSGGPVVCRRSEDESYTQYGITSAGIRDRCGVGPGLYTDVGQFTTWIQKTLLK